LFSRGVKKDKRAFFKISKVGIVYTGETMNLKKHLAIHGHSSLWPSLDVTAFFMLSIFCRVSINRGPEDPGPCPEL